MTKEELTKIALELGWEDLGPQKASYLTSFSRAGFRANFYESTGTLTIQDKSKVYDKGRTWYKVDLKEAKEILTPYQPN